MSTYCIKKIRYLKPTPRCTCRYGSRPRDGRCSPTAFRSVSQSDSQLGHARGSGEYKTAVTARTMRQLHLMVQEVVVSPFRLTESVTLDDGIATVTAGVEPLWYCLANPRNHDHATAYKHNRVTTL